MCVAVGCHVPRADARVDVASTVPLHIDIWCRCHPLEIFGIIVDGYRWFMVTPSAWSWKLSCSLMFHIFRIKIDEMAITGGAYPIHSWSTMGRSTVQEPQRTKALSSMALKVTMKLDEASFRSAMATLGGGNCRNNTCHAGFFYGFRILFRIIWPLAEQDFEKRHCFNVVRPCQVSPLAGKVKRILPMNFQHLSHCCRVHSIDWFGFGFGPELSSPKIPKRGWFIAKGRHVREHLGTLWNPAFECFCHFLPLRYPAQPCCSA